MTKERMTKMTKKIIFSLLAVVLIAGMVGVGSWAYFRDIETSPGNVFQAGTLDLEVTVDDEPLDVVFTVSSEDDWVAPCDEGDATINLENIGSVGGMAYIQLLAELNDENTAWELEIEAGDVPGDPADSFDGELAQNLDIVITADLEPVEGDGIFETSVAEGKLAELWAADPFEIAVLGGHSDFNIKIAWSVDCEVGNIIMSDIAQFTMRFSLEQSIPELTADFSYTPAEPGVGEEITFTDETTGGVKAYTCEWDFDYDGVTFDVDDSGAVVTHSYGEKVAGDFDVCLRVTDDVGTVDTAEKTVTVKDMPPVIINLLPEPGAIIEYGDVVLIRAEVTDDVGLLFDPGAFIDLLPPEPGTDLAVSMVRQGDTNIFEGEWDTTDPWYSDCSLGNHTIYVVAQDTLSWTPEYPLFTRMSKCSTEVTIVPPAPCWKMQVEAVGTIAQAESMGGGAPDDYPPVPVASESSYELWVNKTVTDGYRALSIPKDSFSSLPVVSWNAVPSGWRTTELVMTADGDGKLYVEPNVGDVNVSSVTTLVEGVSYTNYTFGDGFNDTVGSALVHMPLQANVYLQTGDKPDPLDPTTWGALLLDVPLDMYMTTAHTENIVDEPGSWFYEKPPLGANGEPFAETGPGSPAPYVGTTGKVAASGAVLKVYMGLIDVQFVSVQTSSPAAP